MFSNLLRRAVAVDVVLLVAVVSLLFFAAAVLNNAWVKH